MRINPRLISALVVVAMCSVLIASCKKEVEPISGDLIASVSAEATMDAQQDEIDDMATGQLTAHSQINGRSSQAVEDDRLSCAKITASVGENEGSIVIDFDQTSDGVANPAGCQDPRGNIRKGKITVTWQQQAWYKPGSAITISLDSYSINGVVITGQRSISNITSQANLFIQIWEVEAYHKATWPDETFATRTVSKTRTWDVLNQTLSVTQTSNDTPAAAGDTRSGKAYSVVITHALLYTADCVLSNKVYIPITGTKIFTLDGSKAITFDFGSGNCDNTFEVTYNGNTQSVTASN